MGGVNNHKQDKIISFIRAREVEADNPSIESLYLISEFREVSPTDLPCIPVDKDIDF